MADCKVTLAGEGKQAEITCGSPLSDAHHTRVATGGVGHHHMVVVLAKTVFKVQLSARIKHFRTLDDESVGFLPFGGLIEEGSDLAPSHSSSLGFPSIEYRPPVVFPLPPPLDRFSLDSS